MNWTPKSEEEVSRTDLLEPGECDFEVKIAEKRRSDAGNDYLNIMLLCWDANGDEGVVWDVLMDGKMAFKLRHFFYACGCGHIYESGDLPDPSILRGKGGRCKIRLEQDREKKYPPKNAVIDYVVADTTKNQPGYKAVKPARALVANPISNEPAFKEDDVPF